MRFAHANIVSKDWKDLVDLYVKVFERKVVPPIRNQSGAWLEQGTVLANANLERAQLVNHGGSLQGKINIREVPDVGEITFVYARDPDGNMIELRSWKKNPG